MRTLDNAQGLNLMRGRSPGGSRTADINDEQTERFLNKNLNELKLRMKIRKKQKENNQQQTTAPFNKFAPRSTFKSGDRQI